MRRAAPRSREATNAQCIIVEFLTFIYACREVSSFFQNFSYFLVPYMLCFYKFTVIGIPLVDETVSVELDFEIYVNLKNVNSS